MKFSHIVRYVQQTPWAITEDRFGDLMDVLVMRLTGERYTDEQIQARVSEAMGEHKQRIEASAATTRASGGLVAVVPIFGTIFHRFAESLEESSGGTSTASISAAFRQAVADPNVHTILFDVNSPGGTVAGVPEVADEVFAAREQKRIVALSDDLMASAAYHIASQAHEIIAIPSGTVGSIGVFAAHQDLSKRAELLGIKVSLISAGKYKLEGNPFEPLSEDAREQIQSRVDDAYSVFVKHVARGRGVKAADVRDGYGQGRALPAKAALQAGLIDKISTRDEAIGKLVGKRGGVTAQVHAREVNDATGEVYEDGALIGHQKPGLLAEQARERDADLRRRLERF